MLMKSRYKVSAPRSGRFACACPLWNRTFRRCVSYAVSPAKTTTPANVMIQSRPVLLKKKFATDARMIPNSAKSPNRPTALRSLLVTVPNVARPANAPAVTKNVLAIDDAVRQGNERLPLVVASQFKLDDERVQ